MLEAFRVQVADGDDAGAVVLENPRHVHVVPDPAAADLADLDLLAGCVGAEDGGGDDGRHRYAPAAPAREVLRKWRREGEVMVHKL